MEFFPPTPKEAIAIATTTINSKQSSRVRHMPRVLLIRLTPSWPPVPPLQFAVSFRRLSDQQSVTYRNQCFATQLISQSVGQPVRMPTQLRWGHQPRLQLTLILISRWCLSERKRGSSLPFDRSSKRVSARQLSSSSNPRRGLRRSSASYCTMVSMLMSSTPADLRPPEMRRSPNFARARPGS